MISILMILQSFVVSSIACDGGMNKHPYEIPEHSFLSNDLKEAEFKSIMKSFETFFIPKVDEDYGRELIVYSSWSSNTVNAYADQEPGKANITIYGGLARHKAITKDGLVAVLCHELGHHLGGFPKKMTNRWSSAEGQADYFSTTKCLKEFWGNVDNKSALNGVAIPAKVKEECTLSYGSNEKDYFLCLRSSLAGKSIALLIQDLDHDIIEPLFETPDETVLKNTNESYSFSQCRLDTLFNGALCTKSYQIAFSDSDETIGACHPLLGDTRGVRPACWFHARK